MSVAEIIALALVKYGPSLARALVEIFSVENPTREQWDAVFALAEKDYEFYVNPKSVKA
jgi:hypothetical protein